MQVAFGATFDGTVFGGLSVLSYDTGRQQYYVISDDRSAKNLARLYTAQLSLSDKGIGRVNFTGTHPLLDRSGLPFRPFTLNTTPPVIPPNPQGIAFDPARQRLFWCSEGERPTQGAALLDPWVRVAGLDGSYQGQLALPADLDMSAQPTGLQRNRALEGWHTPPTGSPCSPRWRTRAATTGRRPATRTGFVSDNNFLPRQVTQFLLFAMQWRRVFARRRPQPVPG
ncbi:esterase-like activity of phytase family protein [Mycobacterium tilburgii]|uniref:esterase-like activity of phytase family protein n=1 Tax=Mycobacterium tilburgii TaxID=44467 RepID=UPI001642BA18|nr:esterase-like activity of phytase family protein [Mycobacterium tilburgii]